MIIPSRPDLNMLYSCYGDVYLYFRSEYLHKFEHLTMFNLIIFDQNLTWWYQNRKCLQFLFLSAIFKKKNDFRFI